jgi:hypothetical protein
MSDGQRPAIMMRVAVGSITGRFLQGSVPPGVLFVPLVPLMSSHFPSFCGSSDLSLACVYSLQQHSRNARDFPTPIYSRVQQVQCDARSVCRRHLLLIGYVRCRDLRSLGPYRLTSTFCGLCHYVGAG